MNTKKYFLNKNLSLICAAGLLALSGCAALPSLPATDGNEKPTTETVAAGDEQTPEPAVSASTNETARDTVATSAPEAAAVPPSYDDIWDRIRAGFAMAPLDSPYIERHEQWFASNPDYIARLTERARLYLFHIVEEVEKRGLPMEIALLPAIESAYKPHAYSRARAAGLWQFIPSTGRHYGLRRDWWYDGRRDVLAATNAALNYLEKLRDEFDGDWHLALAAYNAGEGRVHRARRYNEHRGKPNTFGHLRTLKAETRNYVPKLIAIANIISDPAKFGIELDPIPNEPYFTTVDVGGQVDLAVLAEKADISLGDLYDINPGFKRWATAPDGPTHLLVPADKKPAVLAALDELPPEERVRWKRHHIRSGDTLSTIARRYGVGVSAIKKANRLKGNRIGAGRNLLIPISARAITARAGNITRPVYRKPAKPPAGHVEVVHKVQSGDTLWSIAVRYGVYIGQITNWNAISRHHVLKLGQILKIWVKPDRAPAAALETVATPRS